MNFYNHRHLEFQMAKANPIDAGGNFYGNSRFLKNKAEHLDELFMSNVADKPYSIVDDPRPLVEQVFLEKVRLRKVAALNLMIKMEKLQIPDEVWEEFNGDSRPVFVTMTECDRNLKIGGSNLGAELYTASDIFNMAERAQTHCNSNSAIHRSCTLNCLEFPFIKDGGLPHIRLVTFDWAAGTVFPLVFFRLSSGDLRFKRLIQSHKPDYQIKFDRANDRFRQRKAQEILHHQAKNPSFNVTPGRMVHEEPGPLLTKKDKQMYRLAIKDWKPRDVTSLASMYRKVPYLAPVHCNPEKRIKEAEHNDFIQRNVFNLHWTFQNSRFY